MKNFFVTTVFLCAVLCCAKSQTVFDETFNDGNSATTGADALGTTWATICPYCGPSGDWIEVDNAGDSDLEIQDVNGPAYWETADFDISSCTEGISISCSLSETGTLEPFDCNAPLEANCNAGDGVKLEVSYDSGASWTAYAQAAPMGFPGTCAVMEGCGTGPTCPGGCGTSNYPIPWQENDSLFGPFIAADDFTSTTFSDCASVGISNTMRFRFTFICWAASEIIHLDNVLAVCSSCALPVEIGMFEAERTEKVVRLNWRTLSESNNKKFKIERSEDGVIFFEIGDTKGSINSTQNIDYEFIDKNPLNKAVSYYRLVQVDMNGKTKYSEKKTVYYEPTEIYFTGSEISINFPSAPNRAYTINVYDLSGKLVHTEIISNSKNISWSQKGFYIIEIPDIDLRKKLVAH